jgi:hypothetical protein
VGAEAPTLQRPIAQEALGLFLVARFVVDDIFELNDHALVAKFFCWLRSFGVVGNGALLGCKYGLDHFAICFRGRHLACLGRWFAA